MQDIDNITESNPDHAHYLSLESDHPKNPDRYSLVKVSHAVFWEIYNTATADGNKLVISQYDDDGPSAPPMLILRAYE